MHKPPQQNIRRGHVGENQWDVRPSRHVSFLAAGRCGEAIVARGSVQVCRLILKEVEPVEGGGVRGQWRQLEDVDTNKAWSFARINICV